MAIVRHTVGLPLLTLILFATAPSFADERRDTLVADFISVCVAAVLAPDTLDAALEARGLTKQVETPTTAEWELRFYGSPDDASRGVSIGYQHFADGERADCQVAAAFASTIDELEAIEQQLEAVPEIGPLDGQIVPMLPMYAFGRYKRPGMSPLVTVEIAAPGDSTSLTLSAWSPKETD